MGDMRFFMGNVILIIGLAFAFSHGGLADMLDEDVDIGTEGEDFDTDRLIFEFDDFNPAAGLTDAITYDGSNNDRDEDYGYVTYNTSDIDEMSFSVGDAGGVFTYTRVYYYEYSDESDWYENPVDETLVGTGIQSVDTSDYDLVEVRVLPRLFWGEPYPVGSFSPVTEEDIFATDSMTAVDTSDETDMFQNISNTLRTSMSAIGQLPSVIAAWVSFSFAIPGLFGRAFQMYIAGFVFYILVRWIWIG